MNESVQRGHGSLGAEAAKIVASSIGAGTKRQSKETEKEENIVWLFVCFNHDWMHTVTAPPSTQAIADQGLEMQRSVVLLRWMDIDRGRDKTTEQSH